MTRNLILTGGVFHPFEDASQSLTQMLLEVGIDSDVAHTLRNLSTGQLFLEILKSIPSMFMAVVTAFGVIFLIFIGISQTVKPEDISKEEFKPKNLAHLPKDIYKVSIIESSLNVIGSIVFLYILNYQSGLVAVYFNGGREALLNSTFSSLLPLINVSIIY